MTKIGVSAFSNCTSLQEIVIPDSVTRMGMSTFYGCTSLTDAVLSKSLPLIDSNTFADCTSLKNITIPQSVTKIGNKAFIRCRNLTDVYYNGTQDQWNSITIEDDNAYLTNQAEKHFGDGSGSGERYHKKSFDWYKNVIATNGEEL